MLPPKTAPQVPPPCWRNAEKFEFLKALMLDDLQTNVIEACFVEAAERRSTTEYTELPLKELRQILKRPIQQKFLEEQNVQKQNPKGPSTL